MKWGLPGNLPRLLGRNALFRLLEQNERGLVGPIALPAHDGVVPDQRVQWWYWTGHLDGVLRGGTDKQYFGFETVVFAFDSWGVAKSQLAQGAVTDPGRGKFAYRQSVELSAPVALPGHFDLGGFGGDLLANGGGGRDRIGMAVDDYRLDLTLTSSEPAGLHYGGHPHPYRFGGYTYYYSRPRMTAVGTVRRGAEVFDVTGTAWFDRQYGALFQAIEQGWQWFAIELADGRSIMLFDFLGERYGVESAGAIMHPDGRYQALAPWDFGVEVLARWTSPHTKTEYPSAWRVWFGGQSFEVRPVLADQELRPHGDGRLWVGPEYWEGACAVTGPVDGRAYVELNGFAPSGFVSELLAVIAALTD